MLRSWGSCLSLNSKIGSKNEKFLKNGGVNLFVNRMKMAFNKYPDKEH